MTGKPAHFRADSPRRLSSLIGIKLSQRFGDSLNLPARSDLRDSVTPLGMIVNSNAMGGDLLCVCNAHSRSMTGLSWIAVAAYQYLRDHIEELLHVVGRVLA